jgi:photosystem II stability/assembly factor-like uncharacterized protein
VLLTVALLVGAGLAARLPHSPSRVTTAPQAATVRTAASDGEDEAPEDAFLTQRLMGGGTVTPQVLRSIDRQRRAVAATTRAYTPALARKHWRFVGPTNIGARVTDVVPDVSRKNTVYISSASGGVWKSTDAGNRFKPIWKKSMPQALGALAMGSDGTLWAGTGESNPGGGSITYGGNGVYKSTNRGKTWRNVGLTNSSTIGRIMVDPKDPKHVFVAVTGDLYAAGGQRGLYATTNGGKSWKRVITPDNNTTGAVDVAIDPKNPKNVLAATWDRFRYPDYRRYAGPGSGVYRSTDGGKTFTRLTATNGLPPGNNDAGRIAVIIDPSHPQNEYALYANDTEGLFDGLYKSTDGGQTWTLSPGSKDLPDSQFVYGWWFGRGYVDPKDSNHIFLMGYMLSESTDGGLNFSVNSGTHVDYHSLAWDPNHKNRVYLANDGGIYRSDKNGASNSWIHSQYEPFSQFFSVDVSPKDPTLINGGVQDNGSLRSWGGKGWNSYYGGDGTENRINPKDPQNVYACAQYGDCAVSTDGGKTMNEFDQQTASDRHGWLSPIEFDPKNPSTVYYAGDIVNKSTDKGSTWTPISPDLASGDAGQETNPLYAAHYGTVTTLALTKADTNVIWAGTDDGKLWETTTSGPTWTQITNQNLPTLWITRVAISQKTANAVYVTFSGYRQGDHAPYIVRTLDGGKTWSNITANLPKAPVNDVILVGNTIYVATDVGVYASNAAQVHWLKVGRGLPLAPITDIKYVPTNRNLYAGSFGRGIYRIKPPRF